MTDVDDYDAYGSACEHECDEDCELEGCHHEHFCACGQCGCPGYCDDHETYNLRFAETGGEDPQPKEG